MTFVIFLGLAIALSALALKSSFYGLKLIAGMSCFAFAIFAFENPPGEVVQGSGSHVAIVIVVIGFGLMVVLAGLGRGIQRTTSRQDWTGNFSASSESFHFRVPDWLKSPEATTREHKAQKAEDYREKFHRAISPSRHDRRK